ncbi:hypothetical protein BDY24DRAFT_401654 [Mrakia frigida]|uniref:uncharacterized protein n=1 Tax=Mrakia frigida TaxID=29902 RepID=UPI003FCC0403
MEILQTRSAFVSGQEVLEHLHALKPELDTIKSAYEDRRLRFRRMKDEEIKLDPEERELTWGGRDQQEGLWSVVDETIKHLSQPELPFTKQSSHGNVALSKALQAMRKFTKVEVLQMVDLNPKTEVELYVIIEELYTRLSPEEITETLSLVKTSLSTSPQQTASSKNSNSRAAPNGYGTMEGDEHDELDQDDWGGGQEYDEDAQGPEDMGFEQDEERDQD